MGRGGEGVAMEGGGGGLWGGGKRGGDYDPRHGPWITWRSRAWVNSRLHLKTVLVN